MPSPKIIKYRKQCREIIFGKLVLFTYKKKKKNAGYTRGGMNASGRGFRPVSRLQPYPRWFAYTRSGL